MEGWIRTNIDKIIETIKNGTTSKQNKETIGKKITRIETIASGVFNFEKVGYCSLNNSEKQKYKLKKGDILFSHINSPPHVGKTAILNSETEIYHGTNLILIRPKTFICSRYLNQYFKYLHSSKYWLGICKQSVNQASVNQTDIRQTPFNYPESLDEQKRIVGVLDEAFAAIDLARANAQRNQANAKDLFDSYLNNIFTNPGEDWEEMTLENATNLITCGVAARPEYIDKGIPFLSAKNVKNGQIIWKGFKHVSIKTHSELTKHNKPLIGDLLYSRIGACLGDAAVIDKEIEFSIFVSLTLIKPKTFLYNHFLKHYLNSPQIRKFAFNNLSGSGVGNLNVGTVRKFPISIPKLKEQKKIVEAIELFSQKSEKLTNAYKDKISALDELKQSLLHQAFTGQLSGRLEKEMEAAGI